MPLESLRPELLINPSLLQVETFLKFDDTGGFSFVNVHEYYENARYPVGFDNGQSLNVSGRQAYHRYLAEVKSRFLPQQVGSSIEVVPCEFVMVGSGSWNELVIGHYTSRDAAIRIGASPGYAEIAVHREAGLKSVLTFTVRGKVTRRQHP